MKNTTGSLTEGSVKQAMLTFVFPYLFACFLQTFYGMADLFVVGLYNGASTSNAVAIGSQVMHMVTVVIVGFAMGTTVLIGRAKGAAGEDNQSLGKIVGSNISLFTIIAVVMAVGLFALTPQLVGIMRTPVESVGETVSYLHICFGAIPFVVAYNVISSVYRGMGDSKHPMIFVMIACVVNVVLDFLFIGGFHMGAVGAAFGTAIGQAVSVIISLCMTKITPKDIGLHKDYILGILKVGFPIGMQDGLIQIAFILITVIANSRGLIDATAVGIVEKMIGFLFLVPSAFLSALSAFTAQNMGAKKPKRAKEALRFSLAVTVCWGIICSVVCQLIPEIAVGCFTNDAGVIAAGAVYLRVYVLDCIFAGMHFCFSGYFCGENKAYISFLHNIIAVITVRVPGAYFASKLFPDTLLPMGIAAPVGSLLSTIICLIFYYYYRNKEDKMVN